jgi:hypothetical protein
LTPRKRGLAVRTGVACILCLTLLAAPAGASAAENDTPAVAGILSEINPLVHAIRHELPYQDEKTGAPATSLFEVTQTVTYDPQYAILLVTVEILNTESVSGKTYPPERTKVEYFVPVKLVRVGQTDGITYSEGDAKLTPRAIGLVCESEIVCVAEHVNLFNAPGDTHAPIECEPSRCDALAAKLEQLVSLVRGR